MSLKRRAAAAAAATTAATFTLIGLVAVPAAQGATGDPVLINEALMSTTSTDVEYLELYGTPGTSLTGMSLITVEGDSGSSAFGEIEKIIPLPDGAEIGSDGFYLIGNILTESIYGATVDFSIDYNTFQNGTITVALVDAAGLGGAVVGDAPDSVTILDGFASTDGDAGDQGFLGVPVLGPDGSNSAAGWARTFDGFDDDTASDWMKLDFFLASPPNTPGAPNSQLVINAVLASTAGSDDPEYIELYGTPGLSLGGLAIVGIESDDQSSNGNIDHYYEFPEWATIGDNGFYLLANAPAATELGVTPNLDLPSNAIENSSVTLGIVRVSDLGGAAGGDTIPGGVHAIDSVALTDGGATDSFYLDAPIVGPSETSSTNIPAGVRRLVDGVDTDTVGDWDQLVYSPRDDDANVPTTGTGDVGTPPAPSEVYIHEVQGTGGDSPLLGDTVTIEGIVTGDYEGDAAMGGFFLQEEDSDADADPLTSEGVFVYTGGNDGSTADDIYAVELGDLVTVTGVVAESYGNTQITVSDAADIVVGSSGNALPTPASISFPVESLSDLEAFEGMLGTIAQEMVISEFYQFGQYGEIVVSAPTLEGTNRIMTPTSVFAPDSTEAAELADLNDRSSIRIDDANSASNPADIIHPINRLPFTLENSFRGGDTVAGLTGPIYYAFSSYRIIPHADGTGYDTYTPTTAPAAPEDTGGDLTVASLNALNYFVTIDTTASNSDGDCGPANTIDCRGADDREEFERQHAKFMQALIGLDADVIGLVEIENSAGVEALATIVDGEDGPNGTGEGMAGLNDLLGEGTYDYVIAGTDGVVGTDAIKVGVIYRTAAVTPLGAAAVLDTDSFLDPLDSGTSKNRAAVAQSFTENASGEVFSVVVTHLKSKGSACGEAGEDGLVGSCNDTRTAAAEVLAEWIDTDPTGSGDTDWLILGDLNSYAKEDPIVALESAGFTDLVGDYQGEFAYSYTFDGEVGYLDYVMSSASLTSQVTGATEWHINADEPSILDYDTRYKPDEQDALFDATVPFRSSDHDAALVGLSLSGRTGGYVAPATTLDVSFTYTDTNGDGVPSIGDVVKFTGTVENTGAYALEGISLAVTPASDVTGILPATTSLAAGDTLEWFLNHTLTAADFGRGSLTYGVTLEADGLAQLTDSATVGSVAFAAFETDLIALAKNAIAVCVNGVEVTSLEQGQDFTVHLGSCNGPQLGSGDTIFVFSTPVELGLGSQTLMIPEDLAVGTHSVAAYDAEGELVGWVSVSVVAAAAGPDAMATTGPAETTGMIAFMAIISMILGGAVVASQRKRFVGA